MEKSRKLKFGLIAGLIATLAFAVGCVATEGETSSDQGTIIPMIIFLVLLFAMVYFLMIRPQRKRQKEQQQLLSELKRGDKIITNSGIYGVIESLSEDSAVIKVESGATMRIARTSIAGKREG